MDLYQIVTDKILTQLEQGTAPWVRPWNGVDGGMPHNAISRKAYRGMRERFGDRYYRITGHAGFEEIHVYSQIPYSNRVGWSYFCELRDAPFRLLPIDPHTGSPICAPKAADGDA